MQPSEAQLIINNLNKVFIPHRSVLEMEALISIFLVEHNYDEIREVSEKRPSADKLCDILDLHDEPIFKNIVDRFINITVDKLKPIAMYSRKHHDINRMGNVVAYTKTRQPLYLALYRLKFKFLLIKKFLDRYAQNGYRLDSNDPAEKLHDVLYNDFYESNLNSFKLMFPEKQVSDRVKRKLNLAGNILSEDIVDMATFEYFTLDDRKTNYIMRSIKASLFIGKLMFTKIDVLNPFKTEDIQIDVEETMLSNDFLPAMIMALSIFHSENNIEMIKDTLSAIEFLMNKVLEGINKAVEVASGGNIKLELNNNLYEKEIL
ncbi:MAG: hypothetical protein JW891_17110 [Candidatus Lokiarchaeota archaeon]|nr:hypothetical protein [Candidatus Lokiarchaeota archaeon]